MGFWGGGVVGEWVVREKREWRQQKERGRPAESPLQAVFAGSLWQAVGVDRLAGATPKKAERALTRVWRSSRIRSNN